MNGTNSKLVTISLLQPFLCAGSWLPDSVALLRCLPSYKRVQSLLVGLFLRNKQMRIVQSVVHLRV